MTIPLDNPRGSVLDENGTIYIADSGSPEESFSGRIVHVSPDGEVSTEPYEIGGFVGSAAGESYYFGMADVIPRGDDLVVLLGLGAWLNTPLYSENRLISIAEDGSVRDLFDVGGYEQTNDPDGAGVDSNPSGLVIDDSGAFWITDAAGNWVARLVPSSAEGEALETRTVTVFPAVDGEDAVPTGVTIGPDGNAYVALFRCQQPTADKGGIARINPDGSFEIVVDGLSNPIDVGFDARGRMFVLEFGIDYAPRTGRLLAVRADGQIEQVLDALTFPTSLAINDYGDVYITEVASPAGGTPGSGRLHIYESLATE